MDFNRYKRNGLCPPRRLLSPAVAVAALGISSLLISSTGFTEDFSNLPLSDKYVDVQAFMQQLAKDHPQTTQLFTLAPGDDGQMIQGLKIGNGPVHNLVVSTHHGNEYGATEVAKAFAQSVSEQPIDGQTVFVIPILNTQGFDVRIREELSIDGDEIDPNRDYPGPCGTDGPFKLKSTAALAQFIDQQNIVASATLHTYFPAVVYPWGISTQDLSTPYDDIFKALVAAATVESGYQTGRDTEVIYPADGAFEDYAYWKYGIWSLLWEIGDTHTPSDDEVHQEQAVNVPGLRRQLEQSPKVRAANHDFTGKCDMSLMAFDQHRE